MCATSRIRHCGVPLTSLFPSDLRRRRYQVFAAWLSVNCPACRVVIISGDAAEGAEQALIGLTFALLQKPVPSEVPIAAVCSNAIRNASGMSGARRTAEPSNEIL